MGAGLLRTLTLHGGTNYLTDTRNSQEVNFTTQGSTAEVESGGPVMNIVPRNGQPAPVIYRADSEPARSWVRAPLRMLRIA